LTSSTFSVEIQIYGITNLHLLTVAYIAVEPNFPHHFNSFDNVPLNYSSGIIVLIFKVRPTYQHQSQRLLTSSKLLIIKPKLLEDHTQISSAHFQILKLCYS